MTARPPADHATDDQAQRDQEHRGHRGRSEISESIVGSDRYRHQPDQQAKACPTRAGDKCASDSVSPRTHAGTGPGARRVGTHPAADIPLDGETTSIPFVRTAKHAISP